MATVDTSKVEVPEKVAAGKVARTRLTSRTRRDSPQQRTVCGQCRRRLGSGGDPSHSAADADRLCSRPEGLLVGAVPAAPHRRGRRRRAPDPLRRPQGCLPAYPADQGAEHDGLQHVPRNDADHALISAASLSIGGCRKSAPPHPHVVDGADGERASGFEQQLLAVLADRGIHRRFATIRQSPITRRVRILQSGLRGGYGQH